MSRTRYVGVFLSTATLVAMSLTMSGCKAQQQMQQQLAAQDERVQTLERRIKDLEADIRKDKMDLANLREFSKTTADTVLAMKQAQDERDRQAAEAKAKAEAAAKAKGGKKIPPKKKHK